MILFMILVLSLAGDGIKHASVHCDGFGATQDNGIEEGYMLTDSRGAAWANTDHEGLTTCHAWKDGFKSVDFEIDIRANNTRFRVTLSPQENHP
jgi:hypothetical protein